MAEEQSKQYIRDILAEDEFLFKTVVTNFPSNSMKVEIINMADKYELPMQILLAVTIVEKMFRPFIFRTIEYIALFTGFILLTCSGKPLPNYSVGVCQIGVGNILKYNGFCFDEHADKIIKLSIRQMVLIGKSIYWRKNLEIAAWLLKKHYSTVEKLSFERRIIYTGMAYNGDYSYGQLIKKLIFGGYLND